MKALTGYNERSWAIDVIQEITNWANQRSVAIKRAGGENTVSTGTGSLFPDVLLYGDKTSNINILQGWELKFPDTPLTDAELIKNARKKADIFGVNSFLVWNVTSAALYFINDKGEHSILHTWNDLNHITKRNQVEQQKEKWIQMLHNILSDISDYFNNGTIRSASIIDSITGNGISNFILGNTEQVAERLKQEAQVNGDFLDEVNLWWLGIRNEYMDEDDPWIPLARILLISWTNKLIFGHLLKSFREEANEINNITGDITVKEAMQMISIISEKCDFWNVFRPNLGEELIPESAWRGLVKFNDLLTQLRLEGVEQSLLQELLRHTVFRSQRKAAGQFSTPRELATLLVSITLKDKKSKVIDPCCGTGTIPRAAYDIKVDAGISNKEALESTWASDKFTFPIQMATLALASPENTGEIIHIFREDATQLSPNLAVNLYDPFDGSIISATIPKFKNIVSNLPFVQQEDLKTLNPTIINDINKTISKIANEDLMLDSRSDLYAYIPFSLWSLLEEGGRFGLILSNSWLSTNWGENFRNLLSRFFHIESIITSGKSRWFKDADVVTNIIVLNKRTEDKVINNITDPDEKTSFVTLNKTIEETVRDNSGNIDYNKTGQLSSIIRTQSATTSGDLILSSYTKKEIASVTYMGIGLNSLFADIKWLLTISNKLVKVNTLFESIRGTRRGWDPMFFPKAGHGIESDYILPVLLSSRDIKGLDAKASSDAFCCDVSEQYLKQLGHTGALNWIKTFEKGVNKKGMPLPNALAKKGMHWYTMLPNELAELVISINPGDRLFFAKLDHRSFINQRLAGLTRINPNTDINLSHALLNSVLGLFYIEALGFGRGLGALDLRSTDLRDRLHMLNPNILNQQQAKDIIAKFSVLKKRPIMPILEELKQADRAEFDEAVLDAYGILHLKDKIKNSLTTLYKIRMSVKN
ncbi:N-6 DNA methylase [Bacillus safensis]|uniref:N-6 DNA methylase n=1 Tax=Bacillus safensis TaxID=561879 RepID=UPI0023491C1B|nr:N-6 DNA methylase [Bacillus safensis]WCL58328.1 N-6 DNA methylase [Bacillus safensis]